MTGHEDNSTFHFGTDEEDPAGFSHKEELRDLKIEKLNQRVTFITVLIPCLIGVLLFVGYLDIQKRLITANNEGSVEIRNLSKGYESRLKMLSENHRLLTERLDKQLPDLSRQSVALKEGFEALEKSISDLGSALSAIDRTKVDLETFRAESDDLKKKSASLINELSALSGKFPQVADRIHAQEKQISGYSKELNRLNDTTATELSGLKSELASLRKKLTRSSRSAVTSQTLAQAISKEQLAVEQKLRGMMKTQRTTIERKLGEIKREKDALKNQVAGLKRIIDRKDSNLLLMDKRIKELEQKTDPSRGTRTPPRSGLIIEQDLTP